MLGFTNINNDINIINKNLYHVLSCKEYANSLYYTTYHAAKRAHSVGFEGDTMFDNMEYVYAVYKHRSFSKAAESLYISQPSLSLTIKKVEKQVGAPLFDRSTNPIRPTECGEEYIRCAERIMDVQNSFEMYLGDFQSLQTGTLVLGASNFFTSYILPPLLTQFKTRYPQVDVVLREANTPDLERQLFDGSLDLIVDNNEFDDILFKKQFFYAEEIILAVPKTMLPKELAFYALSTNDIVQGIHLKKETPAPPLALFSSLPFILLRRGNDTRTRSDSIFSKSHFSPSVILELDQLATAFHVAYRGLGVTFASDTLVREVLPQDKLVYCKLLGPMTKRDNYFHYKHNKYLSRPMEAFLEVATKSGTATAKPLQD